MNDLPLNETIVLAGLEGNNPASITSEQEFLALYTTEIFIFWSALWILAALYMLVRFIVMPLLKKNQNYV